MNHRTMSGPLAEYNCSVIGRYSTAATLLVMGMHARVSTSFRPPSSALLFWIEYSILEEIVTSPYLLIYIFNY